MRNIVIRDTRSSREISFTDAVLTTLAAGGGLYYYPDLPSIDFSDPRCNDFGHVAGLILTALTDFTESDIGEIITAALKCFPGNQVVKIVCRDDIAFLELFHGRTFAFKDIGLAFLPPILNVCRRQRQTTKPVCVLTATSGDTGSAALAAFAAAGYRCLVLYPDSLTGGLQEKQMLRWAHHPEDAIKVAGNFDDIQKLVKAAFAKPESGVHLVSANSVNLGRLVPQIIYYIVAYHKMVEAGKITFGAALNFVVPTGNFGNIYAGFLAKRMGLPVGKLICATNVNKTAADFLRTGVYRSGECIRTLSTAMDIAVPSNLERLFAVGGFSERFKAPITSPRDFAAYSVSDEETLAAIASCHQKAGYLPDPHTAVAYRALELYRAETNDNTPTVIVATAHPYKFPGTILRALNRIPVTDEFSNIRLLEEITRLRCPEGIWNLELEKTCPSAYSLDEAAKIITERMK